MQLVFVFPGLANNSAIQLRSALRGGDTNDRAGEHPDHTIKKPISIEFHDQEFLSALDSNVSDGTDRRFRRLAAIRGKGSKVMGADEPIASASEGIEVERLRNVPGSADFQGVKNRGVPDTVPVDFADSGILGMIMRRRGLASNDPNFAGK